MADLRVLTWFELGGSWGWHRELKRQAGFVMSWRYTGPQRERFIATARRLEPWRIRSRVHTNIEDVPEILELLEERHRTGKLLGLWACWTSAELGELLVEARNRLTLHELGRDRARIPNARFELERIPIDRLEHLIQRHPNMELVDRLREERRRRAV
jgi:hypothetical protein